MDSALTTQPPQDEISLKELVSVVWSHKLFVVCSTLVLTVLAGVAAWLTPKSYEASAVIAVASDNNGGQVGGLGAITSQLGGLASMAGLGVGGDSKKFESLAVLQSEALTEKYIRDNDLLPVLYAKNWDAAGHRWRDTRPGHVPTLWQANIFFKKKVRTVTTDGKTGLTTLLIKWNDPQLASKWANDLVKMTNDFMRSKAMDESERNITYLTAEAGRTDAVGVRQAIFAVLQSEISKAMLARGNEEFAFKIIDPAFAPERPASPQKILWLLGGMFGGLSLSAFVVLIKSSGARPKAAGR